MTSTYVEEKKGSPKGSLCLLNRVDFFTRVKFYEFYPFSKEQRTDGSEPTYVTKVPLFSAQWKFKS